MYYRLWDNQTNQYMHTGYNDTSENDLRSSMWCFLTGHTEIKAGDCIDGDDDLKLNGNETIEELAGIMDVKIESQSDIPFEDRGEDI